MYGLVNINKEGMEILSRARTSSGSVSNISVSDSLCDSGCCG